MILFQIHHMWYEVNMIHECWDSIVHALRAAPGVDVKIKICINRQTYVESPDTFNVDEIFEKFNEHRLIKYYDPEIIVKTDNHDFYNIADWRREVYDPAAKYTVWGETDTILPRDFFAILDKVEIKQPHILTFASRPMWDNSWDIVTHEKLLGYSKPCQCGEEHREDCIELLEEPLKYKDYIRQNELDEFNDNSGDIKIEQIPHKVDGSLVCISGGVETPFIAPGMHFVREDTCLEAFCRKKNIPQVLVRTRLKGHNYKHPYKRVGTQSTRNDKVFKKYAAESISAMNNFIYNL